MAGLLHSAHMCLRQVMKRAKEKLRMGRITECHEALVVFVVRTA